ncbi:MFS transporter [Asanoa sp. WMMD1127]|uniref:MFS transporter n=1 Tax=Asanoa sp. WMMD1127 TaxID=3016107 RepID=UPI002415C647|nr:MFS transporter [Asanoa sp. WMMD1127]MDG4820299.1 MFS transporter [Asanoa sp. WMMD1127]
MSDETRPSNRPATFREVFGQREYRAVFAASALSWLGDYISKAAVTVIVYHESQSVALSAAAFAISYLPWLVGGPLLATLAERYPYRTVMVACDLLRMALIALILIPGLPVPVMLVILFVATLANPPSQAARSALMPLILPGDKLVVGLSLNNSTGQAAQVAGYALGATIAAFNPRAAILVDVCTFLASALLIWFGTRHRPPAMTDAHRSNLLRETGEGFRLVFGQPVLRGIALLVFSAMLFSIVPEGLAAAWAQEKAGGGAAGGYQALIMAANPVGFIIGGLTMARLVPPSVRQLLVRPFAVLSPLVLVPALFNPSPVVVALLAAISGFAVAGLMPVANGLFVQALPHGYRARAFGVMATGVQLMQGAAVLVTGVLAERFDIPPVVGVWSIGGVVLMLVMVSKWPSAQQFDVAIAEAAKSRPPADAEERPPAQRGPSSHRPAHAQP